MNTHPTGTAVGRPSRRHPWRHIHEGHIHGHPLQAYPSDPWTPIEEVGSLDTHRSTSMDTHPRAPCGFRQITDPWTPRLKQPGQASPNRTPVGHPVGEAGGPPAGFHRGVTPTGTSWLGTHPTDCACLLDAHWTPMDPLVGSPHHIRVQGACMYTPASLASMDRHRRVIPGSSTDHPGRPYLRLILGHSGHPRTPKSWAHWRARLVSRGIGRPSSRCLFTTRAVASAFANRCSPLANDQLFP